MEKITERLKLNSESKIKNKLDPRTKEAYGEFGEKWFDKCKNFAISGSWYWTKPKLYPDDFDGYLEDFDELFKPPTGDSYYDQLSKIRYEICQNIRKGNIDNALKLIKDNDIRHFMYGADPDSEHTYGSYMLDCYMYFASLKYASKSLSAYNFAKTALLNLEHSFNWWKQFEKIIKTCKNK